jgi:Flp pilus assembly protein TadG
LNREDGQATVELVAALPALLLAAFIAFQLLAAGYATTLADGAAEAGALALASGRPAARATREALPGWAVKDARVEVRGGRVEVRLRPPALPGALADGLAVTSEASARLP